VEFFGVDGLPAEGPLLDPQVVLQDDVGPSLEGVEGFPFVLQHLLHLLLALLHILADLLQRFLLPLDQIQTQLKGLRIVRSEVLPKTLLIALNSVISKTVLFNQLVGGLVLVVALSLLPELIEQVVLELIGLFAGFEFFGADAAAAVVEEAVV
jgi:hypothetical protein